MPTEQYFLVVAAELANIPFFSLVGIDGVHRGEHDTMDILSDLIQFTRSKVAVVCAGAKNILDIGLTMEFLETHCVPVISYKFDDFPAFYCRSSGHRSPHRIDDEMTIARTIELYWALDRASSVLITTPTKEEDALGSHELDGEIDNAVKAADAAGISGKGLTKYLMKAVDKVTCGRSASANMAVLINTAEVAGRLAAAHASYRRKQQSWSKYG
ncbi:MAG: pseudouridine-5'-phosphate glycosidase [Thiotrichaceae bacterium]|nr:pseudouridine-5'-phosphate glycosidase [Thiotrichaceae bacterium]PCI12298.1 MAG: hypothetical protein COB71_09475 [Thiotrichales bacterium]